MGKNLPVVVESVDNKNEKLIDLSSGSKRLCVLYFFVDLKSCCNNEKKRNIEGFKSKSRFMDNFEQLRIESYLLGML